MAQWIALAAHGQCLMGSNVIRVFAGIRKGIRPQLCLCSKEKSVSRPAQKKIPIRCFSQVMETLNLDFKMEVLGSPLIQTFIGVTTL